MYYSKTENKHISEYTQFTLGGITYPQQWLTQATPEQKAAIGLEEVVVTGSRADDRFYWVSENLVGASLSYTNTPKLLDDREEVDENGQPMYVKVLDNSDPANPVMVDSTERLVTKGLKSTHKSMIDAQVYSTLQPSDWMAARAFETGTEMDAAWKTWRASVRSTATAVKADIDACTTVEQLMDIVKNWQMPEAPK